MTPNSILARSRWLPLILIAVAPFICGIQIITATCSDHNSNDNNNNGDCPQTFTDGFYKKFGLDLGYAGRTHRWAIFTYGSGTSSSLFTALDVSSPTSTTQSGFQIMGDVALAGAYSNLRVSGYGSLSGDRYLQT